MTTPVYMYADERQEKTMAFVMPETMKLSDVPVPTDDLQVKEVPAGRFGVLRFKGKRNDKLELTVLRQLQEWLQGRNEVV